MAGVAALKASCFVQLKYKIPHHSALVPQRISLSIANTNNGSFRAPMAITLSTVPAAGISETFSRLKQEGKVCIFFYTIPFVPFHSFVYWRVSYNVACNSCGESSRELGKVSAFLLTIGLFVFDLILVKLSIGACSCYLFSCICLLNLFFSCEIVKP